MQIWRQNTVFDNDSDFGPGRKKICKSFQNKKNSSFSITLNFYMFYFVFTFYIFNFKAWVKCVVGAHEWWQYLSLGDLNFFFGPQRLIMVTCQVTKNWKWRKFVNWWRIYFGWIYKVAFLKEEKDTVEPRLSGLVWTWVNSPDNRESG